MKPTWILLYFHCSLAIACGGLAIFQSQWHSVSAFVGFACSPAGQWVYFALGATCFLFPLAVAYTAVGRMSAWFWWPVVIVDTLLGFVQYVAVIASFPVRY